MPNQPICLHPRSCRCDSCLIEYVAWLEYEREVDRLAATDPEPDAADDFAAWVDSDPQPACEEVAG